MHVDETYEASVQRFLTSATWLTDADAPAVTTLILLARHLDSQGFQAATVAQLGLTYRALLKRAPNAGGDETDPLEALLAGDN